MSEQVKRIDRITIIADWEKEEVTIYLNRRRFKATNSRNNRKIIVKCKQCGSEFTKYVYEKVIRCEECRERNRRIDSKDRCFKF